MRAPAARLLTVLYLGLACGVQMIDRGLLSMLSPAIQHSFGVGDAQVGALHGISGILIAAALAIPLARFADRYSRKRVLLLFVACWTALTAVGALAPWFSLFFLGHAAAGVTEFALIPVIYSMLPDLAGPRWRVAANLGFAALMAVGAAAGYVLGGTLQEQAVHLAAAWPGLFAGLESWRLVMLMAASLGVPLLLLGLLTADPLRPPARMEATAGSLLVFLRGQRAILLMVLAAGGVAIAVQGLMPLLALALTRRFQAEPRLLGDWMGAIVLTTNLASLLLAASLDRWLPADRKARARPWAMAAGAAMATPCIVLLPWAPSVHLVLWLVAGFLLATCIANAFIPTMVQDLIPAPLRARGFAVYSLVISAFCAAGPLMMGLISDHLTAGDLLLAITWGAAPCLVLAALFAGWVARRYPA